MRLALLLLLAPLLVRAQGLPGSETVILRLDAESLYAHLFRPAASGRAPAMVIVHGFGGVSDTREGFWARELAAFGVAALVVESFTARGIGSSIDDQSRLSTAQGVRDAYAALGYLARRDMASGRPDDWKFNGRFLPGPDGRPPGLFWRGRLYRRPG